MCADDEGLSKLGVAEAMGDEFTQCSRLRKSLCVTGHLALDCLEEDEEGGGEEGSGDGLAGGAFLGREEGHRGGGGNGKG
ncbi:hypothetical protein E2C01_002421 [Portunus trituberculatus]|uniref:Uncharacterized protein n=1 Tax=Portunus trituberculatus TaxID=210409 RepID=A0A5B7CM81_PORTR|nr:hypothetical protein [Portunus trituberculatus]